MPEIRKWLTVLALLLIVPGFTVQAQRSITLQEAVQIALERNINLQKSTNAIAFQEIDLAAERSAFLPSLNFSTGLNGRYGLSFDLTAGQLTSQTTASGSLNLSSSVPIYQNGHLNLFNRAWNDRSPTVQQAQRSLESAELSLERARQNVIFSVVTGFLSVINNAEQVKIRQESLASQRSQLDRIVQLVRAGTRAIADEYQQQAAVAQAELQVINAERTLEVSKTNIVQALELDPFQEYNFVTPSVENIPLTPERYDLGTLIRAALEGRSDIHAQKVMIEANALGVQIAKMASKPTVNLSAGGGTSYSSLNDRDNIFGQARDNRSANLSLNLNFPILDRGQTGRSVQRAQVQYDNAVLDLANLEQSIAAEVRQAVLDYRSAEKQLEVTQVQLEYADRALQAEQERYDLNVSTLVELAQLRSSYVDAASQRAQAVYSFIFQKQVLEYYMGRINPEVSIIE